VAAPDVLAGLSAAGLFGIYADLAFNMYSAMNSSPQTTELFAKDRSSTLWKYVVIGDVGVVGFGLFGSFLAQSLWPGRGRWGSACTCCTVTPWRRAAARQRRHRDRHQHLLQLLR
jgi:hypothetical protein